MKYSLKQFLLYIIGTEFFNRTNWYVFEIAVFYILFYILYKNFSQKLANYILGLITLIFILIAYCVKIDNPWYGSSVCFLLGILYSQNETRVNEFLCKNSLFKALFMLFVCGVGIVLFYVLGNDSIIGNPIARNLSALSFSIFLLIIIQKIEINYSICKWLGNISYEIFLLHFMWIDIVENYVSNKYLFLLVVIVLTIVSSMLLHIPCKKLSHALHK